MNTIDVTEFMPQELVDALEQIMGRWDELSLNGYADLENAFNTGVSDIKAMEESQPSGDASEDWAHDTVRNIAAGVE